MNIIKVLDCTLRDGGYCNQWLFGFQNIRKITSGLIKSNVEIIECGFLTNKVSYKRDSTKFNSMEEISVIIPRERYGKLFVCLINYGEYNLDDIPDYDGTSLDGIRVAFHKKDRIGALKFCEVIKAKGYKVFVQAMVSLNYSDEEFLELIRFSNEFEPYAFYIVDSFGVMKRKDLTRFFYIVENNLKEEIYIGYHAHNNMQLAYSNAQALAELPTRRSLIIDSSILGMGRGAGNLNTELFIKYLNDNNGAKYIVKPLLTIIDEVLNNFYNSNYWGYSLPNYLSASHNCHPNYASYLDDKKTLTVENMDEIFGMMDDEKKSDFDKEYIEELYVRYMAKDKIYEEHLNEFKNILSGKRVLIIAPGRSVEDEKEKVIECASLEDVISISINFDYQYYDTNFIFLSNLRRFREFDKSKKSKMIVTSNIPSNGVFLQTNYAALLNNIESVRDNAGMMLIKYLIDMEVKEITIAGIDGYSHDVSQNYVEQQMTMITRGEVLNTMNVGIKTMLNRYAKKINIEFLTKMKFINI